MGLEEELGQAAQAGAGLGPVGAVLAADTAAGGRAYLLALGADGERRWLVLDAGGVPLLERERVREVASLVVLCELAAELAEELAAQGFDDGDSISGARAANEAVAELERVIGGAPRVASAGYLDRVGGAARELERSLGELSSALAAALAAHAPAVEAFVAEVEERYRLPLR